jgi:hypothetical protein
VSAATAERRRVELDKRLERLGFPPSTRSRRRVSSATQAAATPRPAAELMRVELAMRRAAEAAAARGSLLRVFPISSEEVR